MSDRLRREREIERIRRRERRTARRTERLGAILLAFAEPHVGRVFVITQGAEHVRPEVLAHEVEIRLAHGVNFITLDDVYGTVSAEQVRRFKVAAAKGLPIVLAMHVPIFTDFIWQAQNKFWSCTPTQGWKFRSAAIPPPDGDHARQRADPLTRDFFAYLRREPLLKAILTGHLHIDIQDRFSPTAMEYVVGGNFIFRGQGILFT